MRGPQPANEWTTGRPSTSRLDGRSRASSAGTTAVLVFSFSTGTDLFCNQLRTLKKLRVIYHIVKVSEDL
jgi:hypothetical protein